MAEESDSAADNRGHIAVRTLAMPADTNPSGDIFGGWLLSQMDTAGAIVAHQHAQRRVATVALDGMVFHEPVYVGDLVTCYAEIGRVGTTSITVDVVTTAQRGRTGKNVKVTKGTFVYVALDADGEPCSVKPETAE